MIGIIVCLHRTASLASFYDARQGTIKMDYNPAKKIMMTVGTDRTIKVRRSRKSNMIIQSFVSLVMEYGIDFINQSERLKNNLFFHY